MRTSVLLLLISLSLTSIAQIKVYSTYEDYINGEYNIYKTIRPPGFLYRVSLKDKNNKKYHIPVDSVWAYESKNKTLYRMMRGSFIKVSYYNDKIALYKEKKDDDIIIDGMIIYDTVDVWYFSNTLNGKLYKLNKKNLLAKMDLLSTEKDQVEQLSKEGKLKKINPKTQQPYLLGVFN